MSCSPVMRSQEQDEEVLPETVQTVAAKCGDPAVRKEDPCSVPRRSKWPRENSQLEEARNRGWEVGNNTERCVWSCRKQSCELPRPPPRPRSSERAEVTSVSSRWSPHRPTCAENESRAQAWPPARIRTTAPGGPGQPGDPSALACLSALPPGRLTDTWEPEEGGFSRSRPRKHPAGPQGSPGGQ